jgi:hypothetical protein
MQCLVSVGRLKLKKKMTVVKFFSRRYALTHVHIGPVKVSDKKPWCSNPFGIGSLTTTDSVADPSLSPCFGVYPSGVGGDQIRSGSVEGGND